MREIYSTLKEAGYEVYLVGGAVRDILMEKKPKDLDFTTNAYPETVMELFKSKGYTVIPTGIDYGTITVMIQGEAYEITTFRKDIGGDGRRPEDVSFTNLLFEDLARRDLTINAIAMSEDGELIDPFHGKVDIGLGVIKAVGNPNRRLEEDGLRALRAIRFATKYGFSMDEGLKNAIQTHSYLINGLSGERIFQELTKILKTNMNEEVFTLLAEFLEPILPELKESLSTPQNHPHHIYNVGIHTLRVLQAVEKSDVQVFSALLHDLGKPATRVTSETGRDSFHGHPEVSIEIAKRFLLKLRCSKDFMKDVLWLVKVHDIRPDTNGRAVRRFLSKNEIDTAEKMESYLSFRRADILGQSLTFQAQKLEELAKLRNAFQNIEGQAIHVRSLEINGYDLMKIGFKGPEIKQMQNILLEVVLNDPTLNTRHTLLNIATSKKGA